MALQQFEGEWNAENFGKIMEEPCTEEQYR